MVTHYKNDIDAWDRDHTLTLLLSQPILLLMDEPLPSLDTARKLEILPYLERLRSDFNIPILYVTHAVDEIVRLADHGVIMQQGKVIAQGGITELFSRAYLPLGVTLV